MGGAVVKTSQHAAFGSLMQASWDKMSYEDIIFKAIALVTPSYFIEDVKISMAELDSAYSIWRLIIFNKSNHFQSLTSPVQSALNASAAGFFVFSFDEQLYELVHLNPSNAKLFKRDKVNIGSALFSLITFCFDFWFDESKWGQTMSEFTSFVHNQGVQASAYGLIGDALFNTLRICAGDLYTDEVHHNWLKFYSKILNHLLPSALCYEIVGDKFDRVIKPQRSMDTEDDDCSLAVSSVDDE
jgi:hemoglobin-like flavoprotein